MGKQESTALAGRSGADESLAEGTANNADGIDGPWRHDGFEKLQAQEAAVKEKQKKSKRETARDQRPSKTKTSRGQVEATTPHSKDSGEAKKEKRVRQKISVTGFRSLLGNQLKARIFFK